MRKDPPTFVCDSPGCASTCTLSPTCGDADKALADRGWLVVTPPLPPGVGAAGRRDDEKHYCPGCKAKQAAAAKAD